MGILGATVMPHVIYLHSALTQRRVPVTDPESKRRLFRFEMVDVVIAMTIAGLVNVAMLVIAATVGYITHVAPFYFLFGIGMTLSFASQGAGRMKAPFFAGICRLAVATGGGWYAVTHLQWGLGGVFIAIAAGMITFGAIISLPLLVKPWGPKRAKLPKTGGSDEPALDDRNLEPQPR